MKKTIGILMLLGTFLTHGQDFKSSIGISGGYTTNGVGILAEYNHFINNKNQVNVGLYFSLANDDDENFSVPYNDISLNIGYSYTIIRDRYNRWLGSIGGGGLVGYEILNNGDKDLDNGALINGESKIIYGGFLNLNLNYFISDVFTLSATVNEYYHLNSDLGSFAFYGGIGIKYFVF